MYVLAAVRRNTFRSLCRPPYNPLTVCAARYLSPSAALRSNLYPFPVSKNPSPYQIFHLNPDASPADVKKRYYELVKLYHPDSAESRRLEPDPGVRHLQFSAITRAYAILQSCPAGSGHLGLDDTPDYASRKGAEFNPWRRAPYKHQNPYFEDRFVDERWKDGIIWGILAFSIIVIVAQMVTLGQKRGPQAFGDYVANVMSQSETKARSTDSAADEDALKLKRKS